MAGTASLTAGTAAIAARATVSGGSFDFGAFSCGSGISRFFCLDDCGSLLLFHGYALLSLCKIVWHGNAKGIAGFWVDFFVRVVGGIEAKTNWY